LTTEEELLDERLILAAVKTLRPTMIRALRSTSDKLEIRAAGRFDLSGLDPLGWQHKYQALYLRTLAEELEKDEFA
jgi:hypothetical protein